MFTICSASVRTCAMYFDWRRGEPRMLARTFGLTASHLRLRSLLAQHRSLDAGSWVERCFSNTAGPLVSTSMIEYVEPSLDPNRYACPSEAAFLREELAMDERDREAVQARLRRARTAQHDAEAALHAAQVFRSWKSPLNITDIRLRNAGLDASSCSAAAATGRPRRTAHQSCSRPSAPCTTTSGRRSGLHLYGVDRGRSPPSCRNIRAVARCCCV